MKIYIYVYTCVYIYRARVCVDIYIYNAFILPVYVDGSMIERCRCVHLVAPSEITVPGASLGTVEPEVIAIVMLRSVSGISYYGYTRNMGPEYR